MSEDVDLGLSRREVIARGLGVGALAFGGSAVLAACGGSTSTHAAKSILAMSSGPAGGTPRQGGTLNLGLLTNGSSETIDIRKVQNVPDFARTQALFDPLFFSAPAEPGGVRPGLAVSAQPQAGATRWIFDLRRGVAWHDGSPFGADDVVYTIRSWASSESFFHTIAASLIDFSRVRKRGPLTVEVPLLKAFAAFPSLLTTYNAWVIKSGTTSFAHPIGTGPYKFVSFTPGSSSTFTANADYWGGRPHPDQMLVNSSFSEDGARINAVVQGTIDVAPEIAFSLAKANAGSVVIGNAAGPGIIPLCMRTNAGPLQDVRIRQALRLLTNREAFLTDVLDGFGALGNDLPGHTYEYYASDIKPEYDPEKAKSLLKQAGAGDLRLQLYTSEETYGMNETATLWAGQAQAAGVKVSITQISPSTYYTSATPGYLTNARAFSMDYINLAPPSLGGFYVQFLLSSAEFNETGWGMGPQGPARDALIYDALGETDPAKAADKWHAVQEAQAAEGGYIIPAYFNFVDAYSERVRGIKTTSAGPNDDFNYRGAWLAS